MKFRIAVAFATVLLWVQAYAYHRLADFEAIPKVQSWEEFPLKIGPWQGKSVGKIEEAALQELQPDDYITREYARQDGSQVSLFVAFFLSQRSGRAPHSPKNCLPGAGWQIERSDKIPMKDAPPGPSAKVNWLTMHKGNGRLGVLYWYQLADRVESNEYLAQFRSLPNLLMHRRTDISLIRLIAPISIDESSGEEKTKLLLRGFAQEMYPHLLTQVDASTGPSFSVSSR